MELQYIKALEENDLTIKDLPEDARVGITEINKALNGIRLLEKKGKSPKPSVLTKIKAMDKWVFFEILDHVEGTDKNEDEIPYDGEEVADEAKEQLNDVELRGKAKPKADSYDDDEENEEREEERNQQPKGDGEVIEKELAMLFKSGKQDFSIDEIKSKARNTYNVLFENYEKGGENGIETTSFTLIEQGEHNYKLTYKG